MTSSVFNHRYDRNRDTLSLENQDTLAAATVAILGLGGLGCGVCEMLARTGVGHLVLVDKDRFESSNLNRQLFCQEHLVGHPKALAAQSRVQAINSRIKVTAKVEILDESNLYERIKDADVVMDCLDSISLRFKVQDAARVAGVPIVSGAIAGVAGQVTTIFPQDRGYELIYGENGRDQSEGVETQTGNISYCALMVAAMQSSECIKILLNRGSLLRNQLWITQLWTNSFEIMDLI
ncbi:MAG: HesA/MoeB/ThiF family protein [Proteobacteria bacterium]|nr:HesA/MoeB/ThiF family protein [Pseudomonadota bacterium]MBU1386327.1 HesA/MoeB/ThiF family protein [Pseudomonadota bacterium]MBU1543925.1 HesA/MoeB/ThiF family protein [Pseudomonadota bacterium]MBU2429841.1 HesA/MoeB/ThiF family protein [Pseudomonadota bacterium]MBU2482096.1 HesA/MoeB/ThiF family protein [Pseudomonadota bacterium]